MSYQNSSHNSVHTKLYIKSGYYKSFPERVKKIPSDSYIRYYRDLHDRYHLPLDEETFLQGNQYRYHELCYPIMDKLKNNDDLIKIDLLAIASWSHEYDPKYAALGPHLLHQYNMSSTLIDVCDKGSICTLITLFLTKTYHDNKVSQKSLLLTFDQTTVPRSNSSEIIPSQDAVGALLLTTDRPYNHSCEIIDIFVYPEAKLADFYFDFLPMLLQSLSRFSIRYDECMLHLKKNTKIYKSVNLFFSNYPKSKNELAFQYMANHIGSTCIIELIQNFIINSNDYQKKYQIIIDEDVESLEVAVVILEIKLLGSHNDDKFFI